MLSPHSLQMMLRLPVLRRFVFVAQVGVAPCCEVKRRGRDEREEAHYQARHLSDGFMGEFTGHPKAAAKAEVWETAPLTRTDPGE